MEVGRKEEMKKIGSMNAGIKGRIEEEMKEGREDGGRKEGGREEREGG